MCGIVGLIGSDGDQPAELKRLVREMNALQRHRGPDDAGEFIDPSVPLAMAMRRLAILDVAGGRQPMASDDGRHVLVYNGEIFNSPELRRELEAKGERFATDRSDTEVLLRLLIREGANALAKLNGMFAFALYDRAAGTVLLGRDRFGIKPLYYTTAGGRFAFASELKSLLALPFVGREVDRQSLYHYLSLLYVPGGRSILADVEQLPPGHCLTLRLADRALGVRRWWRLAYAPVRGVSRREWVERIRTTLDEALDRWSLSDVPLAASLSGGLDSSGLVGLARRRGLDIRTVSVGFEAPGEESWNELPLAAKVAEMWETEHTAVTVAPEDLLAALPAMVWHLDEPYGGGLPSWMVYREMARIVKVGLTGVGGDEMFGNYGKWRTLEGTWRQRLGGRSPDLERFRRDYFDRWHYFPDAEKRAVLADGGAGVEDTCLALWHRYREAGAEKVRDRTARTEIETQLAEEFLLMTDRFSMAHSLEARTPFLDNGFVDLIRTIPAAVRTRPRDLKGLLRDALAPVLPPEVVDAPKRGFVIPLTLWLRGPLRPLAERLLAPERLARQGIFAPDLMARHVQPHLDGTHDLTARVWGLLMFQLWHLLVLERGSDAQRPETIEDLLDAA